jgi:hypothetical protein
MVLEPRKTLIVGTTPGRSPAVIGLWVGWGVCAAPPPSLLRVGAEGLSTNALKKDRAFLQLVLVVCVEVCVCVCVRACVRACGAVEGEREGEGVRQQRSNFWSERKMIGTVTPSPLFAKQAARTLLSSLEDRDEKCDTVEEGRSVCGWEGCVWRQVAGSVALKSPDVRERGLLCAKAYRTRRVVVCQYTLVCWHYLLSAQTLLSTSPIIFY